MEMMSKYEQINKQIEGLTDCNVHVLSLSVMEIGHSRDELYTTEGTVLLHMNFALKQNQVYITMPLYLSYNYMYLNNY